MKSVVITAITFLCLGFFTAPPATAQDQCPLQEVYGDDVHCYFGNSCGGFEGFQLFCTYANCEVSPSPSCPFQFANAVKCRLWGCAAAYFYGLCTRCS